MFLYTLVIALLAVVAFFAAYYYRRQFQGLYEIFSETTQRFEKGRAFNNALEKKLLEARSEIDLLKKKSIKLNKKIQDQYQQKTNAEVDDSKNQIIVLEKELEHHREQHHSLVQQLDEAVRDKVIYQRKLDETDIDSTTQQLTEQREKLQSVQNKLKNETKSKEDLVIELSKLQKKYKGVDPKKYFSYKRKCSQYGRLYTGMRGLREMAEEKSSNYENALEQMSSWILKQSESPVKSDSNLGELVGAAMEQIKGKLYNINATNEQSTENRPQ